MYEREERVMFDSVEPCGTHVHLDAADACCFRPPTDAGPRFNHLHSAPESREPCRRPETAEARTDHADGEYSLRDATA